MTHRQHLTRCAPLAIAATLALTSTPLFAQDVAAPPLGSQPTIVIPEPAPAPTIVIPPELTQPSAAVTAPAPAPSAARTAPARPAAATAGPRTPVRAAAPASAAAPAPVDAAPVTGAAPLEAELVPPPIAEPIPVAESAPTAADPTEINETMAIVLGVLGSLVALGIAALLLRRRKPRRYVAARAEPAREPLREPAPLPAGTGAPEFQPAAPIAYSSAAFVHPPKSSSGNLSHSGAAVALPREIPATYEEREALMQRMVDAEPDRANPFRSRRARWNRARLIVQSLGRDFAETDPWIDLSQYPSNWPALARRQAAAA